MVTATTTAQQVVNDIENYMGKHGGGYRDWYVGIASGVRQRLFGDHCVREQGDAWIYRDCGTDAAARSVEDYFHGKGCDGGPGGGDHTTKYVYAYRKGPHTCE